MNRFLDRLADLYTPLRLRGLLMDGHYRFAPDAQPPVVRPAPAVLPRQRTVYAAPPIHR